MEPSPPSQESLAQPEPTGADDGLMEADVG
jgi:hypothetical protein